MKKGQLSLDPPRGITLDPAPMPKAKSRLPLRQACCILVRTSGNASSPPRRPRMSAFLSRSGSAHATNAAQASAVSCAIGTDCSVVRSGHASAAVTCTRPLESTPWTLPVGGEAGSGQKKPEPPSDIDVVTTPRLSQPPELPDEKHPE